MKKSYRVQVGDFTSRIYEAETPTAALKMINDNSIKKYAKVNLQVLVNGSWVWVI